MKVIIKEGSIIIFMVFMPKPKTNKTVIIIEVFLMIKSFLLSVTASSLECMKFYKDPFVPPQIVAFFLFSILI